MSPGMEIALNWGLVLVALALFAGVGAASWTAFLELWRRLR